MDSNTGIICFAASPVQLHGVIHSDVEPSSYARITKMESVIATLALAARLKAQRTYSGNQDLHSHCWNSAKTIRKNIRESDYIAKQASSIRSLMDLSIDEGDSTQLP